MAPLRDSAHLFRATRGFAPRAEIMGASVRLGCARFALLPNSEVHCRRRGIQLRSIALC